MNELNPIIASSNDPTEVSNRIKGLLLTSSGVILYVLSTVLHITITPENYVALVSELAAVIGAIWSLYGLFHAGVVKMGRVR